MSTVKRSIKDAFLTSFLQWLIPQGLWPWVWGGIVSGATMIGGALYSWPWPFILMAGVIVMAFCALSINEFSAWRERRSSKHEQKDKDVARPAGIEFFQTMEELEQAHPLSETFAPGNVIHACLLTGEGIFARHSEYMNRVKRLILPEPNDRNLERLRSISDSIDYQSQINTYRAQALRRDPRSVRLYKDFLGVSLLFCNPDASNGWVQVGLVLPGTESEKRQHFRFNKAGYEAAFISLYETFNCLWGQSIVQTDQEEFEEACNETLKRITPP